MRTRVIVAETSKDITKRILSKRVCSECGAVISTFIEQTDSDGVKTYRCPICPKVGPTTTRL